MQERADAKDQGVTIGGMKRVATGNFSRENVAEPLQPLSIMEAAL